MSTSETRPANTTFTPGDGRAKPRTEFTPPGPAHCPYDAGEKATQPSVQTGLNLYLKLKSPAQMPSLLETITSQMDAVRSALEGLHYVHFARFLPMPDGSALWVITEFDGDLASYIMDFVAVLGDVFNAILSFTEGAPRLPVQKYPREFLQFVNDHHLAQAQPWSAYKHKTVIEINGSRAVVGPKAVPAVHEVDPPVLDFADIQGNVLRGYRMEHGRYFAVRIGGGVDITPDRARAARQFLGDLVSGDEHSRLQVTDALPHDEQRSYCLNVAFTYAGFEALGVDAPTLAAFPDAFRQGPAEPTRSQFVLADTGRSAPEHWELGGTNAPTPHILLSLHANKELDRLTGIVREELARYGLEEVWSREAKLLPDGLVHFGYRDGISQPRIEGMPRRKAPDMQPPSKAGDFLLGKDYVNQYGGNFLGELPHALCDNGTYAAFALLEQDCRGFEDTLKQTGERYGMDPELVAAKMMGRWRNGTPLSVSPATMHAGIPNSHINEFDYAPTAYHPTVYDDFEGLRCPVGAHIRRMNPRGALVTGMPHSRRVIRRALPYGPAFDPANPDDGKERGLIGSFICGDLEMQFEFMQCVWGNKDIATAGLRETRDPVIGTQPEQGGKYVIRTSDSRDPITVYLPRFVTTRGRLYTFMPGLGGLRFLASL